MSQVNCQRSHVNGSPPLGFTFIEMLIVIAMASTLSAFVVMGMRRPAARERDTLREANLTQVNLALEQYYHDQLPKAYPNTASYVALDTYLTGYLNGLPQDPRYPSQAYVYRVSADQQCFELSTASETRPSDVAVCGGEYSCQLTFCSQPGLTPLPTLTPGPTPTPGPTSTPTLTPTPGTLPDWAYRRKLTFDNSAQPENLINFPVLVKLNSSRIDYAQTQDAGQDIRFVDSDESTLLSYEIETWNESGDSFVWVKVPQVDGSSGSDNIWIYYGNLLASDEQDSAAVWNTGYKGVWHFKEGTGSTIGDSTQVNTGTLNHTDNWTNNGKISNAYAFDGGDLVNIPDSNSLDFSTHITFESWINRTDTSGWDTIASIFENSTPRKDLYVVFDAQEMCFALDGPQSSDWHTAQNIGAGNWVYITFTYDGSAIRYYENGNNTATRGVSGSLNLATSTQPMYIGYNTKWGEYFQGIIDEVRISNAARSTDWIAAQYKSMNDGFISFGSAESL